jgi:hypothetical protein
MEPLQELGISCPYCGEAITLLVDGTLAEQCYIEDCEVCCQPIAIGLNLSADGRFQIVARRDDEA